MLQNLEAAIRWTKDVSLTLQIEELKASLASFLDSEQHLINYIRELATVRDAVLTFLTSHMPEEELDIQEASWSISKVIELHYEYLREGLCIALFELKQN